MELIHFTKFIQNVPWNSSQKFIAIHLSQKIPWDLIIYPNRSMEFIYLKTSMEPPNLSEKFHGIKNRKCSYELVRKVPWNLSQNSMEFSSFEFMYPESSMEFIYLKTSMEPQNLSEKFHGINRKCSYELVPKFHGIYPKIPWNLVHWNSCIPISWNSFISKLPWNPRIYPNF